MIVGEAVPIASPLSDKSEFGAYFPEDIDSSESLHGDMDPLKLLLRGMDTLHYSSVTAVLCGFVSSVQCTICTMQVQK